MKNLLSYCGLVDAKITASDKDLPVLCLSSNSLDCYYADSYIKMQRAFFQVLVKEKTCAMI